MPVHIPVRNLTPTPMVMNEDGEFFCQHTEAYIEKACCTTPGSSGMIECGCGGQDSVICPAIDCTGIQDHEVDNLFERLTGDTAEDC